MTTWFGGGSKPVKATSETKLASIQIQTSAYGAVIPVCYGGARIPANLLWYANFTAIPNTSAQQTGKGGGGATQSNTTWSYTADVILGLCEGALDSNARFYFLWRDKEELVGAPGFDLKKGDATQAPWSRVSATRPLEAIGYGGVAYAAQLACDLGGSGAVKNHNFMVLANSQTWSGAQTGSPIAFSQLCNPIKVLNDALTNPQYGAGWPAAMLDTASWNDSAAYTDAANLRSAYAFTSASQMAQIMGDVLSSVNCRAVWSWERLRSYRWRIPQWADGFQTPRHCMRLQKMTSSLAGLKMTP